MKKVITGLSVAATILFTGCGSSSEGDGNTISNNYVPLSGENVKIESTQDVQNLTASLSAVNSQASQANSGVTTASKSISRSISNTSDCYYGGTVAINAEGSSSAVDMTMTYNQCDMGSSVMNGSMTQKGTNDGYNIHLLSTMNNLNMVSDSVTTNMNISQEITTNIYYDPLDIITNGTISVTSSIYNMSIGYENFAIHLENIGSSYTTATLNGKYSMNDNINSCMNGVYDIATLEAVQMDSSGNISSGKMKINGVTLEYNSDATITVTYENGASEVVSESSTVVCN